MRLAVQPNGSDGLLPGYMRNCVCVCACTNTAGVVQELAAMSASGNLMLLRARGSGYHAQMTGVTVLYYYILLCDLASSCLPSL
jgi:hypothetical protein